MLHYKNKSTKLTFFSKTTKFFFFFKKNHNWWYLGMRQNCLLYNFNVISTWQVQQPDCLPLQDFSKVPLVFDVLLGL